MLGNEKVKRLLAGMTPKRKMSSFVSSLKQFWNPKSIKFFIIIFGEQLKI
jgi:hypothetical protein